MDEDDGWTTVTTKRQGRHTNRATAHGARARRLDHRLSSQREKTSKAVDDDAVDSDPDPSLVIPYKTLPVRAQSVAAQEQRQRDREDKVEQSIDAIAVPLKTCPWWQSVRATLSAAISAARIRAADVCETDPEELPLKLVCLGLGSFLQSRNARYQLALAREMLNEFANAHKPAREDMMPVIADPAMQARDESIAEARGFRIVKSVQDALKASTGCAEAGIQLEAPGKVPHVLLLFMPHCEWHLYDMVLDQLWGPQLKGAVLLGNAFVGHYEAGMRAVEEWTYMDAAVASGLAEEIPCPNAKTSLWYEAFNDLAITSFDTFRIAKRDAVAGSTSTEGEAFGSAEALWRWLPLSSSQTAREPT